MTILQWCALVFLYIGFICCSIVTIHVDLAGSDLKIKDPEPRARIVLIRALADTALFWFLMAYITGGFGHA